MPYLVMEQHATERQLSIDDVLFSLDNQDIRTKKVTKGGTVTRLVDYIPCDLVRRANIPSMIKALIAFNNDNARLFAIERKKLYNEFYIPKKHGGLRKIDAPNDELKETLRDLVKLLRSFGMLYHTANYAYVSKRCAVDSIKRHQAHGSRWFLKTDFSDFFGSTTLEFVMRMLGMIFPFCEIIKDPTGKAELEKALSLGFLDGGLPQGTPLSPALTCVMMIPIDHRLANALSERDMVYTRYADDILVSAKNDFKYKEIEAFINKVVHEEFNAPFFIKPEKTRYASSAGRNWNLGVMLNKDNQITIGHAKKKVLKAMINNYITDMKAGKRWPLNDVQVFRGHIAYAVSIERDYIHHIIQEYNKKYGVHLMAMIKEDLGSRNGVE